MFKFLRKKKEMIIKALGGACIFTALINLAVFIYPFVEIDFIPHIEFVQSFILIVTTFLCSMSTLLAGKLHDDNKELEAICVHLEHQILYDENLCDEYCYTECGLKCLDDGEGT
jgi:hypothetical protein